MSFYDGKVIPLSEDDLVANVVGSSKDRDPPSPSKSWKNFWQVSVGMETGESGLIHANSTVAATTQLWGLTCI